MPHPEGFFESFEIVMRLYIRKTVEAGLDKLQKAAPKEWQDMRSQILHQGPYDRVEHLQQIKEHIAIAISGNPDSANMVPEYQARIIQETIIEYFNAHKDDSGQLTVQDELAGHADVDELLKSIFSKPDTADE